MYITSMGAKHKGEVFYEPISKDEGMIYAQYYNGKKVKLIQFKKPKGSPMAGSIEKRLCDLEDHHNEMIGYTEGMFSALCSKTGVPFKTFEAGKGSKLPHKYPKPASPYVITNCESYIPIRGW